MSARRFVPLVAALVGVAMACCSSSASAALTRSLVSSFGSFASVQGLAIDQSTGGVYVYDGGANKVLKYTSSGEPAEFSSTKSNEIAVGRASSDEGEIAVDSSSGPAKGDIYVAHADGSIEIFGESGEKLGALTEEAGAPWGEACGVAVDSSGNVYVGLYSNHVNKYVPTANPVKNTDYSSSLWEVNGVCNVAADSAGNVYVDKWSSGPVTRYEPSQLNALGIPAIGQQVSAGGSTLTIDPSNNHLYLNEKRQVAEFGANGEPFEEPLVIFADAGAGAISESYGVAVNQTSGDVYVPDGNGKVGVFGSVVTVPDVSIAAATSLTGSGATLNGTVNPDGVAVTSCSFKYGTEADALPGTAPCSPAPGSSSTPIAVSAAVAGLTPGTTYRFELSAADASGTSVSQQGTFTTPGPTIVSESYSEVTRNSATVNAQIAANGAPTTFFVEYGPTSGYGASTALTSLGSAGEAVMATAQLSELQPSTAYHFRFVASSEIGTVRGKDEILVTSDETFESSPVGVAALPDSRVYELVTSPEGFDSEAYQPYTLTAEYSNTQTAFPFQAAADGSKVAFVGGPTVGGSEDSGFGGGNQYLGARSAGGGWAVSNLSPESVPSAVFQAFSKDLSVGFLDSLQPLSSAAPGFGESASESGGYDVLYSTDTAGRSYAPLFTTRPPYRSMASFQTEGSLLKPFFNYTSERSGQRVLQLEGASENSTHLLFSANDALTGASEGRPAAEGGEEPNFGEEDNLYESVDGQLRLVNVLPDNTTHANAIFGDGPRFSRVISSDGARIFWTDLNTGHIYLRENGTRTVEVSTTGKYQTAASDGSKAFFTNGDLYEYDVADKRTTDLTPGTSVQTVVGASESGDYVYYVTTDDVFKLWHDGVTTTITNSEVSLGEVTPDGQSVVFTSGNPEIPHPIKLYDAETGKQYCVSCTSGGTKGILPVTNQEAVYMPRWLSSDGSRVFFDSAEALVPQDTNGELDAYEAERPGTAGCKASKGCVYLLSGGSSTEESYFADADESGDNVFIVTRAKLVGSDDNELYDVYDARVGGSVPATPPACTGTGCQGIPGAPPIFATPSSVTFEGVGNFAASAKASNANPKPKEKPKKPKKKSKKKSPHKKKASKKSKAKKSARKVSGHRRSEKGGRS